MYERFYPGMDASAPGADGLRSAHSQFVQAGGIRWHVQRLGQGPVVVLLHGTGSGSFSWRGLMPLLAPHFSVIAPDLPGHVFTSRGPNDDLSLRGMSRGLAALLQALGAEPLAVVGHSAGAALAAQWMLDHPAPPRCHLIGLNPAWLPLDGAAGWVLSPLAHLVQLNPLSAWMLARVAGRSRVVEASLAGTGSRLDAAGMALYRRVLSHPGHVHGVLSMMAAWQVRPLAQVLPRLTGPVHLHIGQNDRTVPPSQAQQTLALLPQAERVIAPGLGHLAHEEDPAGTADQLLRWLA
jgi:magnesium chelatase accessory protein